MLSACIYISSQEVSSENLVNLTDGSYCVLLMLCFAIACIHVLSVKVYQNRHLKVV